MESQIDVAPLPYKTRQRTFGLLAFVFVVSLPFLYIYATGYRFDFAKPTTLVSTGGMYVAVDGTGAEIYIDGELVRETRTFRKAFYAQSLDAGTHRVHVQKEGYQTWVKELPVSKHRVTEAEAFNLPIVPQVRVITKWQTATGTMIVRNPLMNASSTNEVFATSTVSTSTLIANIEYERLLQSFSTTTEQESTTQQLKDLLTTGTSTSPRDALGTTTIISGGAKLYQDGDDIYTTWIGSFEDMPYYYCSAEFPPYSTGTPIAQDARENDMSGDDIVTGDDSVEMQLHPVQAPLKDIDCEPKIRMDRKSQEVRDFDFFPGSSDFVLVALTEGIYMIEVDNRAWQNVQPLILADNLHFHIENGNMYVLQDDVIYQVQIQPT